MTTAVVDPPDTRVYTTVNNNNNNNNSRRSYIFYRRKLHVNFVCNMRRKLHIIPLDRRLYSSTPVLRGFSRILTGHLYYLSKMFSEKHMRFYYENIFPKNQKSVTEVLRRIESCEGPPWQNFRKLSSFPINGRIWQTFKVYLVQYAMYFCVLRARSLVFLWLLSFTITSLQCILVLSGFDVPCVHACVVHTSQCIANTGTAHIIEKKNILSDSNFDKWRIVVLTTGMHASMSLWFNK